MFPEQKSFSVFKCAKNSTSKHTKAVFCQNDLLFFLHIYEKCFCNHKTHMLSTKDFLNYEAFKHWIKKNDLVMKVAQVK